MASCILGTAAFAMNGCGGKSSDIQFWVYGSEDELALFSELTATFNKTYGKDKDIYVEVSAKPTGDSYYNLIRTTGSASSGADVFFVIENEFKKLVEMGFMQEMDDYFAAVDDITISDIPDSMLLKYRYDEVNETKSNDTDPLYGLPLEVRPTALYYNESVFKKAGIIVISVDEEKMDDWNDNKIADNRGHYKREYEKLAGITVPKKGFYREGDPCVEYGSWDNPVLTGETMVFNNRIAMNWDEVEDLARLFSKSANTNAVQKYGTEYGYYTEWWFNYGWSVGGDCLADLNGNGYWNYSLLDSLPNYKVNEEGYVGAYTGTIYKKGETLELTDKLAVEKGQLVQADSEGGYILNGNKVGIRQSVKDNAGKEGEDCKFIELPSTRTAFERYLRLGTTIPVTDAEGRSIDGINISPSPSVFSGSGRTSVNYFCDGKIAMLVEQSSYVKTVSDTANFEWDIAPIAVYKEYVDPTDSACDEAAARGKIAGHSNSRGLMTRKKSAEKKGDKIARFIMWMASAEGGQKVLAAKGYFPSQESLIDEIQFTDNAPSNIQAFAEAVKYQKAGDWWYLKGYSWIDVWAVPLNTKLRNNVAGYTYEDWIKGTLKDANSILLEDYIRNR